MIRIEKLDKYYNKGKKSEQHVLDQVSLELDNTGLVCILGESGSGKTTLLNTLGGLDTFSGGTIDIDGTVLKKYDPKKMEPIRNEKFDYIFQNYYLLQDYSVVYNIKLALNRYDLTEEEKDARVDYVLNMLGLSKYKKKIVSKLSGGQKQRVSIARALVKSPDVILADEPTGNLDEENTIRTMSILKNISKECLVILVSHERRIAEFFADRIIEIQDGKILRDVKNNASGSYERSDDSNIYLREMDKETVDGEGGSFEIYKDRSKLPPKLNLTFAWKDDKLYIKNNMDCDILMEGVENGVQMLDAERPKLDMEQVDDFNYDLPKMKSRGKARLAPKEIFRMALENIRLMGKKQAFVIGIMLVTAVLLAVTMVEFMNTIAVDEASVVATDTHYVQMTLVKTASRGRSMDGMWKAEEYIASTMADESHGDPFYVPKVSVYMTGSGYAQLKNLTQRIQNFSFTSTSHLKSEDLIYGTMPEKYNEVVIDKQLIENTEAQKGPVTSLFTNIEQYVGMTLKVGGMHKEFVVTGISDTSQSVIYSGQNILLGLTPTGTSIASLEELKAQYPDEYKDVELKDDEVLVRQGLYDSMEEGSNELARGVSMTSYRVVGSFTNDMDVDYIFSEKGCKDIRNELIFSGKVGQIYTDDAAATMKYFQDVYEEKYAGQFDLNLTVPYKDQIKEYQDEHSENMDATNVITAVIVVISLVMVYFTIKSNAASRSEELTVYRLLGISRGSILKAYMLEMILMTSYTSLPAVLITGGVIRFISSIPSLQISMIFPWWSIALLLVGIYLIHIIISVLPVYGILSRPPATLAVKD